MNPKESVQAVLRGETPERVPVVPAATYATAHLAGIPVRAARHDAERVAACLVEGQLAAGSDGLYTGWESSFNLVAAALGCGLSDPEEDVPTVERPLFADADPDPAAVDPTRVTADPTVALHRRVTALVRERAGAARLLWAYVPGPFTLAGLLAGSERLLLEAAEHPERVEALVAAATGACRAFAATRTDADILVVADPLASCSLISPRMFRRFAQAPLTELMAHIREDLTRTPALHICGRTTPILADMAATGPAILELDHAVDLAAAREKVPPTVVLQGNLDPALLLAGPTERIADEARRCLAACAGRPFILSTGCEVALRTPLEHYRALTGAVGEEA